MSELHIVLAHGKDEIGVGLCNPQFLRDVLPSHSLDEVSCMGLVVIKICIAIFFDHGSKAAPIREHLRSPGVSPWQTRSFLELS